MEAMLVNPAGMFVTLAGDPKIPAAGFQPRPHRPVRFERHDERSTCRHRRHVGKCRGNVEAKFAGGALTVEPPATNTCETLTKTFGLFVTPNALLTSTL